MNDPRRWSDEDLADFLAKREPAAAEALVDRYLPGLFDFAARVTLDLELAAEVTETSLRRAWEEGGERPAELSLRSWLFGLARGEALDGLRQRGEQDIVSGLTAQDERFSLIDGDGDEELARWVWQTARGQRPRDFATLDLALRRRLPAPELADVSSLSRTNIDGVLTRLRTSLEEGFAATILYNRGRVTCSDLDELARKSKGGLGPALRRDIGRHASTCDACEETLTPLPRATAVYALLRDVEPPLQVWASVLTAVGAGVGAGGVASDNEVLQAPLVLSVAPGLSDEVEPPDAMAADEVMADVEDDVEAEAELEELEPDVLPVAIVGEEPDLEMAGHELFTHEPEQADEELALAEEMPAEVESEAEQGAVAYGDAEAERELTEDETAEDEAWIWPDRSRLDDERPEEPTEAEGPTEEEPGPVAPVPVGAAGAPLSSADGPDRIHFEGGAYGLPPPQGPRGRFSRLFSDDDGRRRIVPMVVLGVLTLLFAYLGFVVGTSIEGGGSAGAVAPLPTRAPGLREIACGTGPISIDQGSSAVLTFDSQSLSGYQISNIGVRGVSSTAVPQSIDARQQQGLSIRFEASPIPGSAGRTDEYSLVVTFSKGEERTVSECTVRVRAPGTAAAPTATPVAAAPTATSTPQPVVQPPAPPPPAPAATSTPVLPTATLVPPTNTPPLCTATPLPTPTGTPILNPFPTFTPVVGPC